MVLWFVTLAVLGMPQIVAHPGVLRGLSPDLRRVVRRATTPTRRSSPWARSSWRSPEPRPSTPTWGTSARCPSGIAWFAVAFPALILNYLGQAALILNDPAAVANPFYLLAPGWARLPLVVLATCATVIASQAVISGAFSVSRQAVRLGYLPQLTVRHTSTRESGQIYVPAVNWLLFGGVLVLIAVFGSSQRLATAYGLAVTGTLLLTTRAVPHLRRDRVALGAVEAGAGRGRARRPRADLPRRQPHQDRPVAAGCPCSIAAVVVTVMTTWQRGRRIVTARRVELEGPLPEFVDKLHDQQLTRVPGTAVFPHPTKETAPLALRANVEFNHVLHEQVVIVSVARRRTCRTSPTERAHHRRRARRRRRRHRPPVRPVRLPGRPGHPGRAAPGPTASLAELDIDRGHRLLLPLAHHDRARPRAGHERLAQAAVHRAGAQRRQPRRPTSTCPSTAPW